MSLIVLKVFVMFRLLINYFCLVRVCRKSVSARQECKFFVLFFVFHLMLHQTQCAICIQERQVVRPLVFGLVLTLGCVA